MVPATPGPGRIAATVPPIVVPVTTAVMECAGTQPGKRVIHALPIVGSAIPALSSAVTGSAITKRHVALVSKTVERVKKSAFAAMGIVLALKLVKPVRETVVSVLMFLLGGSLLAAWWVHFTKRMLLSALKSQGQSVVLTQLVSLP